MDIDLLPEDSRAYCYAESAAYESKRAGPRVGKIRVAWPKRTESPSSQLDCRKYVEGCLLSALLDMRADLALSGPCCMKYGTSRSAVAPALAI